MGVGFTFNAGPVRTILRMFKIRRDVIMNGLVGLAPGGVWLDSVLGEVPHVRGDGAPGMFKNNYRPYANVNVDLSLIYSG